jgi:hypothetical protein
MEQDFFGPILKAQAEIKDKKCWQSKIKERGRKHM